MEPAQLAAQQLTVSVLLWGSAVVIGIAALDKSGRKAAFLWGLTALFVILGFLVKVLWEVFPDVSRFLTDIAAFAPTWYFLIGIGFLVLIFRWRDARTALAAEAPSEPTEAVKLINAREMGKIGDLGRRVKKLEDAVTIPEPRRLSPPERWTPPTMTVTQRERISVALAEVEDFLRDTYPAFANAPNLGKYRKLIMLEGPQALEAAISKFAGSAIQFSRDFNALISRHDTELKIAGLDLHPLLFQTAQLRRQALDVSSMLGKAPPELRDPDILEPHVVKIGRPVAAAKESAAEMLSAVKLRRIALARGAA